MSFNKFSEKDFDKFKKKMKYSADNITTVYEPSNESDSNDDIRVHNR